MRFVLFCFLTYSPFLIHCCVQQEWVSEWTTEICFLSFGHPAFPNIVCWGFFPLNCLRASVQNEPVSHICKPEVSQKRLPNYLEQRRDPMGVVGCFPDVNGLKQLRVTNHLAISSPRPWDSASSIGQCRSVSTLQSAKTHVCTLLPCPHSHAHEAASCGPHICLP